MAAISGKNQKIHDEARRLYMEDSLDDEEIATILGVKAAATIKVWRRKDRNTDRDWDRGKVERAILDPGFEERREGLFYALFNIFDKERKSLESIPDPKERLRLLEKYIELYSKLTDLGRKSNPKISTSEIVVKTMMAVVKFAQERGDTAIVDYLSVNLEDIKNYFFRMWG